jgi:hypothetical protein
MQQEQSPNDRNGNTGHSIVHGSTSHFNPFGMREREGHSRHMVGGSLDQVSLMQNNNIESKSNNGSPQPGNTNNSV